MDYRDDGFTAQLVFDDEKVDHYSHKHTFGFKETEFRLIQKAVKKP